MKALVCLTIFLFTSVQFGTKEIVIYGRDRSINFLADTKFICVATEKIEDKRLIAWIGFRDRDFVIPILGKQVFRILGLLLNGGFLRFIDWSLLPRKPPNASFYLKKGLC